MACFVFKLTSTFSLKCFINDELMGVITFIVQQKSNTVYILLIDSDKCNWLLLFI
jgi:hypothetical protein